MRKHCLLPLRQWVLVKRCWASSWPPPYMQRATRSCSLAPSGLQKAITAAPVRYGRIDLALSRLDEAILETAQSQACDSIVLIDPSRCTRSSASTTPV